MSLVQTYRRLAERYPALGLTLAEAGGPAGPDWVDGARLAGDEAAREAWLAAEAEEIRAFRGRPARDDVVASRVLHGYLWSVGLLISGPWYLDRRVPRLRPEDVWVRSGGSVRVAPGSFVCLPGDPAAGSPQASVADREEDLHAELRRAYADHVRPLLTVLRPRLRRGTRALWGMAGDDLVSGLWRLGTALGEEEHGAELATRVLPAPHPPFPGGADFRRLPEDHPGEERLTRTRTGCCLYYTIEPAETCATCPRLRAGAVAGDARRDAAGDGVRAARTPPAVDGGPHVLAGPRPTAQAHGLPGLNAPGPVRAEPAAGTSAPGHRRRADPAR